MITRKTLLKLLGAAASVFSWPLQATAQDVVDAGARYADGTYAAKGIYGNLPSFVTVTARIEDGVIDSVSVLPHATDPTSLALQRRFAAAVPAVVVGRRLAEVNVGRLAGSTGTPRGFNDAIRQIRDQARLPDQE